MKILYDHQIFTGQKYGGISRYFFELIKRFDGIDNLCKVATVFSDNVYYNKDFNPELMSLRSELDFKGKKKIISYINSRKSLSEIKKGEFNVFHPTYYDDYFLKKIKDKPYVVTCHDLIHEKFSNQFENLKQDVSAFEGKKQILENSSKIIAVSETTKNDILHYYDIDHSKIDVVYHGNSLINYKIEDKKLLPEDYILFVGNRSMYKNFTFLVRSISDLLVENKLKLVCVGGGDFNHEENSLINSLGLQDYIISKKIYDDRSLSNYYTNALFFVFPSLYEGFGIPVLEAFACKCPVLLSNGGSLKEVGGNAVLYFDPKDADSLRNTSKELIDNQCLRQEYIDKGTLRLKNFTWDKTFQETLKVYESVIDLKNK